MKKLNFKRTSVLLLSIILSLHVKSFAFEDTQILYWSQELEDLSITSLEFQYELKDNNLSWEDRRLEVEIGTIEGIKSFSIILQNGAHTLYWYTSQEGTMFEFLIRGTDLLSEYFTHELRGQKLASQGSILEDYKIYPNSIEGIVSWKHTEEVRKKDFEVFAWQSYPQVLVFAFRDRNTQSQYFKRLAFYMEKTHTRGTIQELNTIAHRSGWGAHDYKVEDLVEFFNAVEEKEIELGYDILTEEEQGFRELLLQTNIIKEHIDKDHKTYEMGAGQVRALVSFSRADPMPLQRILLFHELLHTFYFEDKSLREKVAAEWRSLSREDQDIWKKFLTFNGYDAEHEYLVQNEFFAYALQRPLEDLPWYLPSRILAEAELKLGSKIKARARKDFIAHFISSAEKLSEHVYDKYGIKDGDVRYVKSHE